MIPKFFTYFTSEFLAIGLTSVLRYMKFNPNSHGFVFCFGLQTRTTLENCLMGPVQVIDILDIPYLRLEYSNLLRSRTKYEAIISMKPILFEYVLRNSKENEPVVYFDPDVMFFGTIEPRLTLNYDMQLFAQLGTSNNDERMYGKFNAGLIVLRNSLMGRSIAQTWRSLCVDWCRLTPEEGRFADQKYLERFLGEETVNGYKLVNINLSTRAFAHKNLFGHKEIELRRVKGVVLINNLQLIAFHFHGLRIVRSWVFTGLNRFGRIYGKGKLFKLVYKPVLIEIAYWHQKLSSSNRNRHIESIGDKTSQNALASLDMQFAYLNTIIELLRKTKLPISWL